MEYNQANQASESISITTKWLTSLQRRKVWSFYCRRCSWFARRCNAASVPLTTALATAQCSYLPGSMGSRSDHRRIVGAGIGSSCLGFWKPKYHLLVCKCVKVKSTFFNIKFFIERISGVKIICHWLMPSVSCTVFSKENIRKYRVQCWNMFGYLKS